MTKRGKKEVKVSYLDFLSGMKYILEVNNIYEPYKTDIYYLYLAFKRFIKYTDLNEIIDHEKYNKLYTELKEKSKNIAYCKIQYKKEDLYCDKFLDMYEDLMKKYSNIEIY